MAGQLRSANWRQVLVKAADTMLPSAREDDPDDIVRLEIAAALERDIRVIPILG
jgi:hypothetical protein